MLSEFCHCTNARTAQMAGGPCSHPPFALSEPACAAISQVNFIVGYLSWRAEQRRQKGACQCFSRRKSRFYARPMSAPTPETSPHRSARGATCASPHLPFAGGISKTTTPPLPIVPTEYFASKRHAFAIYLDGQRPRQEDARSTGSRPVFPGAVERAFCQLL